MKSYRRLGWVNYRVVTGLISLGISVLGGGAAQAATQYEITCTFCHQMPPSDSDTGARDAATGATKGNHQRHASNNVASCAKCHGTNVLPYQTFHRDKAIEFGANINNSPTPGSYSRPFANQTSVPPTPLGSCSNVNCHFEADTPSWGSPALAAPAGCSQCHGVAPATGNHPVTGSKHGLYYGSGTDSCRKCHPDHASAGQPFSHATSAANRGIAVQFSVSPNSGGVYSGDGLNFLPSQGKTSYGSCSGLYCHSNGAGQGPNRVPVWGTSLDCTGCHNHTAASGAAMNSGSHRAHVNVAGAASANHGCADCHARTVSDDVTIADVTSHVNGSVDVVFGAGAGPGAAWNGAGGCSALYCHSDGSSVATGAAAGGNAAWGGAGIACDGCHGFPPAYGNGTPKANSHPSHNFGCQTCHAATTGDGATIADGSRHANHVYDVFPGAGVSFSYAFAPTGGTCSNISCHNYNSAVWGSTLTCASCHTVSPGGD